MGQDRYLSIGATRVADDRERVVSSLFDAHYPHLKALACTFLGDAAAAEEVVSEAFVKALSGWRRFRNVEHHSSYLGKMVVNECRARLRRHRVEERVNALVHGGVPQIESGPEDTLGDEQLLAAVRALPGRQRACILLFYMEDMSQAEIAEILNCSIGTVKSQLHKARTRLERELSDLNGGGVA